MTPAPDRQSGPAEIASVLLRAFFLTAAVYLIVKIVFLATYSIHTRFVMDEYESIGGWVGVPTGLYSDFVPVRTILAALFYQLPRLITDDAVGLMTAGRLQSLFLAVSMLAMVYGISRNLGRDRAEALFSVVIVLTFSTFIERAFRIRADTVATTLALVGVWAATRQGWTRGQASMAGVFAGLAFLATQKAVFAAIALGLGYLTAGTGRKRAVTMLACFVAGWIGAVLAYALFYGGSRFPRVLWLIFTTPAELGFEVDRYYAGFGRWRLQTVGRNLAPYLICTWGLILALKRFRKAGPHYRLATVYTLVLTALVFTHNQPWPYVFVTALPVLGLWSVEPIRQISAGAKDRRNFLLLFTVVLAFGSFVRNVSYLQHDNAIQNQVVRSAERLLAPSDTYCDGIRMVGSRHSACDTWWDAWTVHRLLESAAAGDSAWVGDILRGQPKVWILSYRFDKLAPVLQSYIDRSYVLVDANIRLSGTEVPVVGEVEFLNYWPGCYRAYDRKAAPVEVTLLIDGEQRGGRFDLSQGSHRIAPSDADGSDAVNLLPCDVSLDGPVPAQGPRPNLFEGVYSF